MERQRHGIISLFLIALAVGVGVVASLGGPLWITMAYLVVVFIATITTVYCYCGKCVARAEFCGHVLPGKVAGLLPHRAPGAIRFWRPCRNRSCPCPLDRHPPNLVMEKYFLSVAFLGASDGCSGGDPDLRMSRLPKQQLPCLYPPKYYCTLMLPCCLS
jgi:hypothetical protein